MKKYPIGFRTNVDDFESIKEAVPCVETIVPRRSVVEIYFPSRKMYLSYYNDQFDLKVGDLVYVDGKLAGHRGRVTEVNYAFKIKLEDYKKVIAVIDTTVSGELHPARTHFVSFDMYTIPYRKVLSWFKAPEEEAGYVSGDDEQCHFPLDNLKRMRAPEEIRERGYDYYLENRVVYIELCDGIGHALVQGREIYEIEFCYHNGEISNLKCGCFCSGACKHEFAVMLQLRETLEFISKHYEVQYKHYFAAIEQDAFMKLVLGGNKAGTLRLEGMQNV